MLKTVLSTALELSVAAALVLTPAVGTAQATAAHEHTKHGKLALNQGKRWPTDEPLRNGMINIRALVEPQLGAIHAGKLTATQYLDLAAKIEGEVAYIVASCKLDPKADAMLHLVIAEIGSGVDAMKGKAASARPADGAATVVTALDDYGRYFDHPAWKPIRRGR